MEIYCYRDLLDGEQYEYFGCTLYFVVGPTNDKHTVPGIFGIIARISAHIKADKTFDTAKAIEKIITRETPLVTFVRACIKNGTGKTRCYFDAKAAGKGGRKQVVLALYEYLKLEDAIEAKTCKTVETITPDYSRMSAIQEHFADELETHMGGMTYTRTDLSQCSMDDIETTDADRLQHGDFVFEIGERRTATFRYYGHYHKDLNRFKPYKMFAEFDLTRLLGMLNNA